MKTKLFLFLAMLAITANSFASTKIGDLYYNLDTKGKTAEVTYGSDRYVGDITIPSSVTYSGKTYSVKTIGENAFSACNSLTSIMIPNSITTIGQTSFYRCTGLTSINIPNSVTTIGEQAFEYCNKLTSVTIPNSVTTIGYSAFHCCTSLTSVTIPNSVTSLDNLVFSACKSLITIELPNSVTSIGDGAFYGCSSLTSIKIPNSVTSIGASVFSGCSSLTSIVIPNSVTFIGNSAFSGCSSLPVIDNIRYADTYLIEATDKLLSSYTIQERTRWIGSQAFEGCINMTSIVWNAKDCNSYNFGNQIESFIFGDSVEVIPNSLCKGMSKLKSVIIPNSVKSIGGSAFWDCDSIISVIWNAKNCNSCNFGSQVMSFTFGEEVEIIPNNICSGMNKLTSINIPNSVKSIGGSAFSGCRVYEIHYGGTIQEWLEKLWQVNQISSSYTLYVGDEPITDLIIPQSITSIRNSAFFGCTGLTSVTIPNSVTSIGDDAFYGCSNLTSVTIPNSVTSIGDFAFNGCGNLASVTLNSNAITKETYTSLSKLSTKFGRQVKEYIIGENVENIGDYAFYQSDSLISIIIPNKVSSIGTHAFSDCGCLTTITINRIIPPTNGGLVFSSCPNLKTIYLPCENAVKAYSPKWGEYSKYFQPLVSNKITMNVDSIQGKVNKIDVDTVCDKYIISAIPNYGYHFIKWSDDDTENPRTIIINNDSSITAIFSPNIYTFSATYDESYGFVEPANGEYSYLSELTISASSHYGYHFTKWADGNTDNPRTITIERDSILTAQFAPNKYQISLTCNASEGKTQGAGSFDYLSEKTITATSNYGYHFAMWSDGNTDNPRIIKLTQDTTFEALFAKNIYDATIQSNNAEMGNVTGGGSFEYLSLVTISATSNYGYHFVGWNGINNQILQNAISVSKAISIASALGAGKVTSSKYTIVGYITGKYGNYVNSYYLSDSPNIAGTFIAFKCASSANVGDHVLITGYLTNYNGNTPETTSGSTLTTITNLPSSNPCTFTLTQDTTITAVFAKNSYTLTAQTANSLMGSVNGSGTYEYLDTISIKATPTYGYHFVRWNDGSTDCNRKIVLTRDTVFTATFAKNPVITYICDRTMGRIVGDTTLASEPTGYVTFEAVSNYGYHFVRWADGNTDNPRTVFLTKNVSYEALFAVDRSGTCGVDNKLQWQYSPTEKTLIINGSGSLGANYTFGVEAPIQMTNLYIGNDVTEIGAYAFYQMTSINHLVVGGGVTYIGDYAFAECKNFDDITCYATTVPTITSRTFANVGNKQYIYLFVPEGRERAYKRDTYWGEFDIQVQNAETVTETTTEVDVVPTDNTATITWPYVNGAETYEIEITQDGEIVCTLIFNSNGQLVGIAFAPSRNNTQQKQTTGFRFTVTGLTSSTHYGYAITSKDSEESTIDRKSGSFTTTLDGQSTEGLEDVLTNEDVPQKVIINDKIYILRGDKIYSITGQEVK